MSDPSRRVTTGRRVVVAGPYPTMPGPESAATFGLVRDLVAAGDEVTVVSPAPSAAHHHADPGGPRGAARLARFVGSADLLHLRLDATSVGAASESPRVLPARIALNGVLRRARESEVRLDRVPANVSPQWVSLVLGKAARVLVQDDAAAGALVRAGLPSDRVVVAPEAALTDHDARSRRVMVAASAGAGLVASPTAADLQELVRRRSVEDRIANRRATTVTEGTASLPLRHLVRMERAPVRSNKPGGAFLKKAIAKLLQWQFDNVIASVNRLHQATIDAIENLEAGRAQVGDDTKR